ncbi:MAG: tape measure protein [Roseibium sp.]|nr:tape measure protein [Roseibium sp.]
MSDKITVEMELDDNGFIVSVKNAAKSLDQISAAAQKGANSQKQLGQQASYAAGAVSKLNTNAGQAARSIQGLERRSKSFLSTMRDLSIVVGATSLALGKVRNIGDSWAGEIIKVNAEFERLGALMQGLSKAADPVREAADNVKYLREQAKQTPFTINAISDAFVKMKATGMDPLDGSLRAFTDAVAAAGGTDEMLKRVSIAISQMSGKGVVQMEELRQQLGEAIPRATELMARSMGVTYAELVDQLSTGRVEAKAALAGLRDELLRTFGGSGQRMMQTFNGMLSKTKSLLMDLSEEAGNAGYFEAVKNQLQDLNSFLETDAAKTLARDLGRGLATAVNAFREAINWVIRFREEIAAVGTALVYAFGARLAFSGITALASVIGNLTTSFRGLNAAVQNFNHSTKITNAAVALGQIGMQGAGISRTAGSLRTLGSALNVISIAAGTVLPIVGTLGVAIVAAAQYFDLFDTKATNAYESLKKFGAYSREQVKASRGVLETAEAELAVLERERAAYQQELGNLDPAVLKQAMENWDIDSGLLDAKEKVAQLRKEFEAFDEAAVSSEAGDSFADMRSELEKTMSSLNGAHDREMIQIQDIYKAELDAVRDGTKDIEKVNEAHRQRQYEERQSFYDEQLQALRSFHVKYAEIAKEGDEVQQRAARQALDHIAAQRRQIREMQSNDEVANGVGLVPETPDFKKNEQKAVQYYDNLKAQIDGYKAELSGANYEVEKLRSLLETGKFGPKTGPMEALIDKIVEAKIEAEELKEITENRSRFERDLERQLLNSREKLFEAQNRGLTDWEKFLKKVDQGFYKGAEKSEVEKMVDNLRVALDEAGKTSTRTADAMANTVFGEKMMSSAKSFATVIGQIAQGFASLRSVITGIPFDKISDTFGGVNGFNFGFTGNAAGYGAPYSAGNVEGPEGGYYNNLIGRESGGNPNARAKTSSATGLGQFTKGTWMDFIRSAYPELMAMMTKGDILGLRTDPQMSRQAIHWLTQKNAGALRSQGLDTNDANLYLAHFLGSGDAAKVLRAGAGTPLQGLINSDSIAANQSVLSGKTVGDLMNWITRKFGNGYTAGVAPGQRQYTDAYYPGSRVPAPLDLAPQDAAKVKETEANLKEAAKIMADNRLADSFAEAERRIKAIREQVQGMGKSEAAMIKAIRAGDFGADTDPASKRYEKLLNKMRELDQAEKRLARRRQARTDTDNLTERTKQLEAQAEAARRQLESAGKNTFTPSEQFFRLEEQWNQHLSRLEEIYGRDNENYRVAQDQKAAALQAQQNLEITQQAAAVAQSTEQVRRSTLTATELRRSELQDTISMYQSMLQNFRGTADERLAIETALQANIKALRQQAAASGPMAQQMQQWSDFGTNMEQAMVGWLDGGIDAIANFVATGKADFKSLAQSIIKDIVKISLKWATSKLFKGFTGEGKGQAASAVSGGKGGGAKGGGIKGGLGKAAGFGIAHTGGIAGGSLRRKFASPAAFVGAPRFHTGGIIRGMGIGPDEVPIIAKKGEGVFTPEQMKAMGNMGGAMVAQSNPVNIANNITVNGSAGTPKQNEDLAKQMSRELEGTMRKVVVSELQNQKRHGGVMYGRG